MSAILVDHDYAEWLVDWLAVTGGALVLWPCQWAVVPQPIIWPGLRDRNRIEDVYRYQRRRSRKRKKATPQQT